MVKVILELPSGRESRLIPEHTPLRKALEQFHMIRKDAAYMVNGSYLNEEDLDRDLVQLGAGDEVCIIPTPKLPDEPVECPPYSRREFRGPGAGVYQALVQAREAIEQAILFMGTPADDDEEPPF